MKKIYLISCLSLILISVSGPLQGQLLRLPDANVTNLKASVGRTVGVTDIMIRYNSPAVRGREGGIWGTAIVPYGYNVLGFGSNMESPWRAGANESTTISFSTDVTIQGKPLKAGQYGFFIAVYPDSCILIFNQNTKGWGSYFYDKGLDVLKVATRQQKNMPASKERLEYAFSNQTDRSVEIALEWERWRIPFKVEVDIDGTTLASIQSQMSGAMGFDPPSLQAAAAWCLSHNTNLDQAYTWITSATDPNLGGLKTFAALSTKAGILGKMNKKEEADQIMAQAVEQANAFELHAYGRQLLAQKKMKEAMDIFETNYKKHEGKWPTAVGMMRGYSAMGNYPEALKYAKMGLTQAPDDLNKNSLQDAVKKLEAGKPL
ncbi:MAG TPA: DUF2911 domain-containing protein [Saprospiraceae bacterium]|nr:DUF2911 domain-containing protein [Saprospiraceae bacterium]HNT19373.1 DUF2911 domain-containing protein [Saprospiraceae bacterium]